MIYNAGNSATGSSAGAVAGAVITQVPPLDPASTNLLLQSAAFNVAPWVSSGGLVIVSDAIAAPNGIVEADSLRDPGVGLGQAAQNVAIPNDALTRIFSCYFTFDTSVQTRVGLLLTGGAAPVDQWVDFNPANGGTIAAAGTAFITAIAIEGVTWFRVEVQAVNNASGNVTAQPYIQPASTSAPTAGNVYAWGAQLETRARATQQIPTTTAQIPRAAGKLPWWLLEGLPPGTMVDFGGAALPAGFIAADGSNRSRTTFAPIFAQYGTTWGAGDGVTTFGTPDARRRVRMGSGGVGTATIGNATGNVGGEENHPLIAVENGPHGHGVNDGGHVHQETTDTGSGIFQTQLIQVSNILNGDNIGNTDGSATPLNTGNSGAGITIQSQGSGTGHNTIQTSMICTVGIKT